MLHMKAKTFLAIVFGTVVLGTTTLAWAKEKETEVVDFAKLSALKSFEVEPLHDTYDPDVQHVDAELYSYLGSNLEKSGVVPMASPAEGVIHLDCHGNEFRCAQITARITLGKNGPVVWSKVFKNATFFTLLHREQKEVAKEIADHLAQTYQKAWKNP